MSLRKLTERGDTIVEVMIVLAILSFAIIISYSSANRSLEDARQSEQNSYATELAQQQVEQIRSAVRTSLASSSDYISNLLVNPGTDFCMYQGGWLDTTPDPNNYCQPQYPVNSGIVYAVDDTLTELTPQSTSGVTVPSGFTGLKWVNLFKTTVTWDDVFGKGKDIITLYYRVYPPPAPMASPPVGSGGLPPQTYWDNNGAYGTCSPAANCSTGSGLLIPTYRSEIANGTGTTMTFDYNAQPSAPPGTAVPNPGQTGLTLKLCYNPTYTGKVSISVGGVTEFPSVTLNNNGTPDTSGECPLLNGGNYVLNVPLTIPVNSNSNIIITIKGGKVQLYDAHIY